MNLYFRHFSNEDEVAKAGFKINSLKEYKIYTDKNSEGPYFLPKDYIYDGSVWEGITFPDWDEHSFFLYRVPILTFDELWNLFIHGDNEDSLGAKLFMFDKHEAKIIAAIESLKGQEIDKKLRKKLLELKKSWVIERAFRSEKIKAAIDAVLEK